MVLGEATIAQARNLFYRGFRASAHLSRRGCAGKPVHRKWRTGMSCIQVLPPLPAVCSCCRDPQSFPLLTLAWHRSWHGQEMSWLGVWRARSGWTRPAWDLLEPRSGGRGSENGPGRQESEPGSLGMGRAAPCSGYGDSCASHPCYLPLGREVKVEWPPLGSLTARSGFLR